MSDTAKIIWHPCEVDAGVDWDEVKTAAGLQIPKPASQRRELGWVEIRAPQITPKDELLVLLKLAAEIEHALLVQYLYAAYSLDLSQGSAAAILRGVIKDIALQEMAHFLSVQNLLLAVGGPDHLHIGRDKYRAGSLGNPLPFSLEPINAKLLLQKYVLVEMPATIEDANDAQVVAQMMIDVKKTLGLEPHRVGAAYTQIYWLLQPTDAPTGELHLAPNSATGLQPGRHLKPDDFTSPAIIDEHQGQFNEWWGSSGPNMLILPIGNATTPKADLATLALSSVFQIMGQGEGQAPGLSSHFERFLQAVKLNTAAKASIALPIASTPFVGAKPTEAAITTPITQPYVRAWAEILDVRYTMLLLDIGMALANPFASPDRKNLNSWARADMRSFLSKMMTQLTSNTLTSLGASGPTFGLLIEDLPQDSRAQWVNYRGLLQRQTGILSELKARIEFTGDSDGQDLISLVEQDATDKNAYLATKL